MTYLFVNRTSERREYFEVKLDLHVFDTSTCRKKYYSELFTWNAISFLFIFVLFFILSHRVIE